MSEPKLDINYVESKIQNILNREFKDIPQKRVIKRFPSNMKVDRLNFACPVCTDSQKSVYKKRGNLYTKSGFFKCFNCDTYMSFTKLCDTFNEKVDLEKRIELYEYFDANITYTKTDDYLIESLDKLINIEEWVEKTNTTKGSTLIDVKPIQKGSQAYNYLTSRYIHNFSNIFQGIYRKQRNGKTYWATNVIIILNRSGDKLVGYQLRNLENNKDNRFYKIVEFDEIYNFMNPENPIDFEESIMYNKLSHFYNILNVNFEDVVTIFEGYLDTIFFPNSVGLVGANSTNDILNFLLNAEDLNIRFFFDNDEKGYKKSKEIINKGYSVFLWKKLFAKMSIGKELVKAESIYKNIIDLNDLVKMSKNTKIESKLGLQNFFSYSDWADSIYLNPNADLNSLRNLLSGVL